MKRVQLVAIRPPGTLFGMAWAEALDSLRYGLLALGVDAPVNVNRLDDGLTPIVFGSHHLQPADIARLPRNAILYNFEQLLPGYPWFQPRYLDMLGRFQVWDYAAPNVNWLRECGVATNARHVPPGYVPQWSRIRGAIEDIDVLFFGLLSPRRQAVLDSLSKRGLVVKALAGVFGEERDRWISRAKVVLNLRLEEHGLFESLRVNYLLANRKAVVTEAPATGDWNDGLLPGVRSVAYDDLVEACIALLGDDAARTTLGETGFQLIQSAPFRMTHVLRGLPQPDERKMSAS